MNLSVSEHREVDHYPVNVLVFVCFHYCVFQILLIHLSSVEPKSTLKTRPFGEIGVHFRSGIRIRKESD